MVAGAAAMASYTPEEVGRINALGGQLRSGIAELLTKHQFPGEATGYGSFVDIHLTASGVRDYRTAARGDHGLQRLLHMALLLEGALLCSAPDDVHVDRDDRQGG